MALMVERINSEFNGEFTFQKKAYSVPFALPGDLVHFRLQRRGRKRKIRTEKIERASSYPPELELTEPFCPYFGRCGGCRGQRLSYETQLRLKAGPVQEAMKSDYGVDPLLIPAPSPSGYRNRMDFVVEGNILGLRPAGEYASFVDIETCALQKEPANRALKICRGILARNPGAGFQRESAPEKREGKDQSRTEPEPTPASGPLKYVTIRSGADSGVVILTWVAELDNDAYRKFRDELVLELPPEFSLIQTSVAVSQEVSAGPGGTVIRGRDSYREMLGKIAFETPYDAFFQPNPPAFDLLLDWALARWREIPPGEPEQGGSKRNALTDLYSGAGTLSAVFARESADRVQVVRGYEFTASAQKTAQENLSFFSGAVEFFTADLNKPDPELLGEDIALLLIDPPRAGMSPGLIKMFRREARREKESGVKSERLPPWILYVSCNPKTQLRDLTELSESYEVVSACIVDCYAQTPHLEQAVFLRRRQ